MRTPGCLILATAAILSGCGSVDPRPDYARLAARVAEATASSSNALFDPSAASTVRARVDTLLSGKLTADEAARVALLNSPRLQSAIYRIGGGRADVVQAGLLSNPSIAISFRFGAGGANDVLDADLAQSIADLWQIPARVAGAEREQEALILEVADEAAELVARAHTTFWEAVGAERQRDQAEEAESLFRSGYDAAVERQRAGVGTAVEVSLARSVLTEAEIEVKRATLRASTAMRSLLRVLGVGGEGREIVLDQEDLERGYEVPTVPDLVAAGMVHRLDLQAAQRSLEAAEARIALQRRSVFGSVAGGASFEKDDGSTLGPLLDLELPIFDQNRAQIARAEYDYLRVGRLRDALALEAEQEIRDAADRLETATEIASLYQDEILAQRREALDLAETSYQAGKSDLLTVLEARRTFVEARSDALQAMTDRALARSDLERAVGVPMKTLEKP